MNFNLFKKKATETANVIADRSAALAKKAADKTKTAAKIAKLKADAAVEKENLKKAYTELGRISYELFKSAPGEDMLQAITEIDGIHERIDALNAEIEALRSDVREEDGGIEFEIVEEAGECDPAPDAEASESAAAEDPCEGKPEA